MTTAAAVAAHQHCCEEDEQGKHQEDHQADCVIGPLVVFVCGEAPQLVEEILDTVRFPIHGFRMPACEAFKRDYLTVVKV